MARARKSLWILVPVVVALALGTALWQTSDLGRAARSLETERAAAKAEGVPLDWDDLRRLEPPVPDADNAAVPYRRAFASYHATEAFKGVKNFDDLTKAVADGTANPADVATLRAGLEKLAPALAEARAGADRKGFSFDRPWEQGPALLFPEYADAKSLSRALVLRATLSNDPASAVADLRAAAILRARIGAEPVLIAALVGDAMEANVHRGIRALARRGGAWTAAVRPVLDDLGPIPPLRRTLAGEVAFSTHTIEEIAKDPKAFTPMGEGETYTPLAFRLTKLKPVRDAYQSRILQYWREAWKNLPADPADFRTANAALPMPTAEKGPSYAMLEELTPVFSQFAQVNAKVEADRRLTRSALDLWSGGTPSLPKDPFGTGSLKLKRNGPFWTLYSVGPDGIDDGGKPQAKFSDQKYDIVVTSKAVLSGKR